MNMEASFSCADGRHDLIGGCRLLRRSPPRNLAGNWDKALLAALAIHLLTIFFFLTLMQNTTAPPLAPEQVVVMQLAEWAPFVEATSPPPVIARPPEPPAKITPASTPPAPDKPLPRFEKKPKQAPAKPTPEARQAHSEKKPLAKPDTPAPAIALALEPAAPPIAENGQQSVAPVEARQSAGTMGTTRIQTNATASSAATGPSVIEPRPINQPKPAYPPQAQRRGLEGKVILRVTVGADGAVRAVTVSRSSSHALLDEAAVAGVSGWRFQPGQVGGEKKEMTILLPVDFRLR